MTKRLWLCWFQGESTGAIPSFNKLCIDMWRDMNPDWDVVLITFENVSDYLPDFIDIIHDSPDREIAQCADLLRVSLLAKYGGVWVDASVLPTCNLDTICKHYINDTGFFAYRFLPRYFNGDLGDREIAVWFLAVDGPKHPVIVKWKTMFLKRFRSKRYLKYFTFAQSACDLFDSDDTFRFVINNMVQVDQSIPRCCDDSNKVNYVPWDDRYDSYMYKRPVMD